MTTTKASPTANDAGSVDTPELRELVEEIIEQAGFYDRPSLLGLPAWEHFIAHIHAWRDQGSNAEPRSDLCAATRCMMHAEPGSVWCRNCGPQAADNAGAPERDLNKLRQFYELAEEAQRLHDALCFWLPSVPAEEGPIRDRIVNDAYMLVGYDDMPDKKSAEELGWITLAAPASPAAAEVTGESAGYSELRRLAMVATPGPWTCFNDSVETEEERQIAHIMTSYYGPELGDPACDAAYIAAANPAIILAMIDRLEELEGRKP